MLFVLSRLLENVNYVQLSLSDDEPFLQIMKYKKCVAVCVNEENSKRRDQFDNAANFKIQKFEKDSIHRAKAIINRSRFAAALVEELIIFALARDLIFESMRDILFMHCHEIYIFLE